MVQQTNAQNQIDKWEGQQLSSTSVVKDFTQIEINQIDQKKISKPKHEITYRADIDGLRTVAVGIVVIFHAWPLFMPGGFIGVDVFFVISGYLISNIIIKQALKNKFSYRDFYSRRIKRIYPALITVLIFVLFVGVKKLFTRSLEIMSKTMVASTLFAANIQIFTADNDYFDPETQSNPLLHLWSLGVEEQFYIFWPLLLTLIFSKFQNKAFHILSVYTILSFVLSIFCVFKDTQFAFYFPFCRFWQMSVGGLIAYLNIKIQNKIIINIMSLVSIIAIMTVVWILDEDSLFPGFWALIPTLGAACIIQAGKESFFNKYILSSKPFVFIGKISYPLYLWHWPLLVFSRILYPEGSSSILARPQFIVLISVGLSILTYYFVENPFRFRKQKIVPIVLFVIILGLGMIAYNIEFFKNYTQNITQKQKLLWQKRINGILLSEQQRNVEIQLAEVEGDIKKEQLKQKKLKKVIDPWVPLQQDYIIKNGRKIPNSSKNPRRQPPTIQKIEQQKKQRRYSDKQRHAEIILEKKVNQESKYWDQKANEILHHFQVSNQGQQKQLFIIGDSHAKFILHRFHKLYQDSVKQGRKQKFPTILSIVRQGFIFIPQSLGYNITIELISKFKPQRILFVFRWIRCQKVTYQMNPMPQKWNKDYKNIMSKIESELKELKKRGFQIYLSGISPCGEQYNPWIMTDENGIIQNNIKPFNYSVFHQRYIEYFDTLNSVVKNVDVGLVDFTDNMCYNNICQVLIPTGYPVTIDRNHQTKLYARNWAGSVDFLTQF